MVVSTLPTGTTWISVTRAAEIIGCTARRVRQLIDSGELRAVPLTPRAWAVAEDSADAYSRREIWSPRKRIGRG